MTRTRSEMESMVEAAKRAAGWNPEDMSHRPVDLTVEGKGEWDRALEDRSYAEGVEAALLWVMGSAGDPLPR